MYKLPFQVAAPVLRYLNSSARSRRLCDGAQSSSQPLVVVTGFIPTLSALFRFIYFWFKSCKMKARGGKEGKERSLCLRQVALVYVARPQGPH